METGSEPPAVNLQDAVDALKLAQSDTRTLTRQVAALLMERDEPVNANRIYSLIRVGSMVTIQDELKLFWRTLKNQLLPKLNLPGVPQALLTMQGETLGTLWGEALRLARAQFDEERAKSAGEIASLKAKVSDLLLDTDRITGVLEERERQLAEASEGRRQAEREMESAMVRLDERQAAIDSANAENLRLRNDRALEVADLRQREDNLRAEFDVKATKLAEEVRHLAEISSVAEETMTRMRVEIKREVDHGESLLKDKLKLQSRLESEARRFEEILATQASANEAEVGALTADLDGLHQKLLALTEEKAVVEGRLQATIEERDRKRKGIVKKRVVKKNAGS